MSNCVDDNLLTRFDAADFLRSHGFDISKTTLDVYASRGGGPRYQKWGKRCLYRASELLEWAEGRLTTPSPTAIEHRSTAKAAPARKAAPAGQMDVEEYLNSLPASPQLPLRGHLRRNRGGRNTES